MGLGCNAAGVMGCRIIDSPRERRIAALTNALIPCNGRFPALLAICSIFFAGRGTWGSLLPALAMAAVLLLGVLLTFFASWLLSRTLLRGEASACLLELPPYRRPRIGQTLWRSLVDRTLTVLGRAVVVAVPAGLLLWLLQQGSMPLFGRLVTALDGAGRFLGLDGTVLTGFLLALPANELVLPVLLMGYTDAPTLTGYSSLNQLQAVLAANGWTTLTALCFLLFLLCHWPCSTTLLTVRRECGGWRWAAVAAVLPTVLGILLCLAARCLFALFGG